jgi:hypothetical protein
MLPCWQGDRTVLPTHRVDNSQAKARIHHRGINRPDTITWILARCGQHYTRCSSRQQNLFLGAVTKLRTANNSFVMSVCASVRLSIWPMSVRLSAWNNSVPTERIFTKCLMKFHIAVFFRKSVEKIQFFLKYNMNNGYVKRRTVYIFDHMSLIYFQNEKYSR